MIILDDLEMSVFMESELSADLDQIQHNADGTKEMPRTDAVATWKTAKAWSVECKCSHQFEAEVSMGSPLTEVSTLSLFPILEVDWSCQLSKDVQEVGPGTAVGS